MEILSRNEERHKNLSLRHMFFPDIYGFISEATIAIVALVVFNANKLSNRLLKDNLDESNPFVFSLRAVDRTWSDIQQIYLVQQVLIFLLWAIVGVLIYVLVFRSLQIIFGVKSSIGTGIRLARQENYKGYLRWLVSLHDFSVKMLVALAGLIVFILGAFVCFGVASQELRSGLLHAFPANLQPLLFSFIAGLLSIRLVVIGISLLSSRFRNWYVD